MAHLDLDAFFASVEMLERPELAAVPLVVGGDPGRRGVVSTANYAARAYGIRSAMSAAEAWRRCPQAVFVRPRHGLYREYSERVWDIVAARVDVVEQVGIDEGYLDLTELVGTAGEAGRLLHDLQAEVMAETALGGSFGCATGKTVAKIASDHRKPFGITVVPTGREREFLGPLPLRALPGVGPRSEERLARAGLASIGDLAGLDDGELARLVPGSLGPLLRDRARGLDDRPVARERAVRISIGQEETFDQDVDDPVRLHEELERMIHRVVDHLERDGRGARTVTAKLRYPDWTLSTRSRSTPKAVRERAVLVESAHAALERALADRPPPVRLLGVAVSNLEAERQPRLPGV